MTGVLFIVNVPRKEHEEDLKKKEKNPSIKIEKEANTAERASKIFEELKENKKFCSLRTTLESYSPDENVISKCKSTDCLHSRDEKTNLYKCRSENTIVNNFNLADDSQNCLKSSWGEIKHVIRPKSFKFKITQPGITNILSAFHFDTPLETILSEIIFRLDIKNAAWNSTRDDKIWQVIFSLESGSLSEELLQVLRTFGIGSRLESTLSVLPCALHYQSTRDVCELEHQGIRSDHSTAWTRFSSSVRARNNLAQVLHGVTEEATLTFDWLFLLVVAAFVAAIGLVEDSTVILVASMLISPLMGPITAATLGTTVRDRSLQLMGLAHELLGLFLSLVIGFVFGLAICAVDEKYGVKDWPTYEMMSRCEIRSLWVGVLVAIPSGAGVALAVLGEYTASLVGVAISASLLPPAVNAGLLWSMAAVHLIFIKDETKFVNIVKTSHYSRDQATELAVLGSVSLCLTLVNIVCIFLAGVAVYKVKEVCPLDRRDITWWRGKKNLRQASLRKNQNRDSSSEWNKIYSTWCNGKNTEEKEECDVETTESTSGLVNSDTVTYRRYQPVPRVTVQNIDVFCNRKSLVKENYEPLESPSTDADDDKPKELTNNDEREKPKGNKEFDFKTVYPVGIPQKPADPEPSDGSFYNEGFESVENEGEYKDTPVIEPTLSQTMEARQFGIVLGSKTFDV